MSEVADSQLQQGSERPLTDPEFEEARPFLTSGAMAGVVICRVPDFNNLHAGVIYREAGEARVLHLGFEDNLLREWRYRILWACPEAEPERLGAAAGMCRRVWSVFKKSQKFPYGVKLGRTRFDPRGKLRLDEDCSGLTCGTFIVAIYRSVGLRLVDEDTWPIRTDEDREWVESLARFATPEHLDRLLAEVDSGCARFHPHEVVGSCGAPPPPASFQAATVGARRVLEKLDAS